MTLTIETYVLGPIENNTYLIIDESESVASVIDPAAPSREMVETIKKNNLKLQNIWLTHAHFDHISGVKWLRKQFTHHIDVALHQADLELWQNGGGAADFGFDFDPGEIPDVVIHNQQSFFLGSYEFEILHTPGHTHGHVTYYCPNESIAFCGDLIFFHGIGRTDLDVSNEMNLFRSIKEKIFALPDETVLYPGHGIKTSVSEERMNNPFL